jgi:pseudaminic acid synthase
MGSTEGFLAPTGTFVVAELSANHNGRFDVALATIKAAKQSGADAVKVQTYTPDTMTIDCENEHFQIKQGTIWDGTTLYRLYQQAYTPWDWQPRLKEFAEEIGLLFFSTPFDVTAVDFLEKMAVPIYKIASFEITDIPLIEYVASKRKPLIISTGIATLADIEEAVTACKRAGNDNIALLKCTSAYPAPIEEANLLTIPNMRETFNVPVGLSDHTLGTSVALAAVALGARIVEKHFILDRGMGGPDAPFSMEPAEFKQMVESIRTVEQALGGVTYELSPKILKSRELSRSLFVVRDMVAGEKFTATNVRSIRPGYGLAPKYLPRVLGRTARTALKAGVPLDWDCIG